jgi:hypothetical protein
LPFRVSNTSMTGSGSGDAGDLNASGVNES